jgi:hypothetical protein
MLFSISDPTFRKILTGIAIALVVLLVGVFIWRRRSKYVYPNTNEATGDFMVSSITYSQGRITVTYTGGTNIVKDGDLVYVYDSAGTPDNIANKFIPTKNVNIANYGGTSPASGAILAYVSGVTPTTFEITGDPPATYTLANGGAPVWSFTGGGSITTLTSIQPNFPTVSSSGKLGPAVSGQTFSLNSSGTLTITLTAPATGFTTAQRGTYTTFSLGQGTLVTPTWTAMPSSPNFYISSLAITGLSVVPPTFSATTYKIRLFGKDAYNTLRNTAVVNCQIEYAINLRNETTKFSTAASGTVGTAGTGTFQVTVAPGAPALTTSDYVIIDGIIDSNSTAVVFKVSSDFSSGSTTLSLAPVNTSVSYTGSTSIGNGKNITKITNSYTKLLGCASAGASAYTTNHCKYTNTSTIPNQSDDPSAFAAYTRYMSDIQIITNAYTPADTRAASGLLGSSASLNLNGKTFGATEQAAVVAAARKADVTLAVQRYLATVCPGFYIPANSGVTDPTNTYKAWTASTGTTLPSLSAASPGFWATTPTGSGTGVKEADILSWAVYAGKTAYASGIGRVDITSEGAGYTNGTYTVTVPSNLPANLGCTSGDASLSIVVSGGAITSVVVTAPGSFTTIPSITLPVSLGTPTTPAVLTPVLANGDYKTCGPLLPAGISFTNTSGTTITSTADRYTASTGDTVNYKLAYLQGPGTYPRITGWSY